MCSASSNLSTENAAFIHETALFYGHVHLDEGVSVWPYVTMRAEINEIRIGPRTNIQDFTMVHVGFHSSTIVGADCSITHHATLHGCEIGNCCLIGINATVMDGAKIGANSIVAGHSIVTESSVFPENSIISGVPAKLVKTKDSSRGNQGNARFYLEIANLYARGIHRLDKQIIEKLAAKYGM